VNVAAFSAAFGGGGHHNAAGCTLDGSLDDIKALVYGIVEKSL
jgi:phosphoesterase RecJ-like protein